MTSRLDDNKTDTAYAAYRRQFDRCGCSVFSAILVTYGGSFLLCGVAMLFSMGCGVFAPVVLHHVIDAFSAPQIAVWDLWLWLTAFFTSKIVNSFVSTQMNFHLELVGLRLTGSLKSLVFEKAMHRSIQSKSDPRSIDVANLFSSDINGVLWAALQVNALWVLPLQIAVIVYLLHDVIGLAAFAGLSVIGLSMFAGFVIAGFLDKFYESTMEREDTRMKVVKEVFNSIQTIKFNAWEPKFADKIANLRAHELSAIAQYEYLNAFAIFVLWASPLFVSMASFSVYSAVMGQQLTAAKVFTAMALFSSLRSLLSAIPDAVSMCVQAKVSLGRIQSFLQFDEHNVTNVTRDGSAFPAEVVISIQNGSFGWTKHTALLKNVNITVKKGDLVVVYGSVGAGKSSLCSALLGEMDKLSGLVFVRGRVAYYSQQTWIQNMTIRDNVLFGKAYDEKFYHDVLDACGLVPDLEQLPAGDLTEIGQEGVNLSGGQKARLCLARACYADADVLILDSPLAAVDAVVQNEIFSKCLCTLLENKTVVLVTHALDIISPEAVDYKLEVVEGEVKGERRDRVKRRSANVTHQSPRKLKERAKKEAIGVDSGRLVEDEERVEGRVSKEVFLNYVNALGGFPICVFLLAVQTLWQGFQIASDFWLSRWTGQKLNAYDEEKTEYNLKIYVLLGLGSAFMVLVRSVTVSFVGLKASKHLFNTMTRSLLNAPLRFFDATPIGRIINRYGLDMATVDYSLSSSFGNFLGSLFYTMCQLATTIYAVNLLGVLVIPLAYIFVKIAKFYLAPSREISRLGKVSESPVLSHVTGSEQGVVLIRAFGPDYVDRAIAENCKRNDARNKVWFARTVVSQWFQLRILLVGCGLVILVVLALVYMHSYLTPGMVGLAFTYALNVDGGLAGLVRVWSWFEVSMVSPERILEYAAIPAEGDSKVLQIQHSPEWPRQGTIQFDNVSFSYKEGAPAVLERVSFSIMNNEKIGIVGRTGAGKSSLTMALFRINELNSGRIIIDGVDIASIPLQSLRSHLAIIPQAPVLYKGPLRSYMDPFDEYCDSDIWEAFEKVEMKEQIAALEGQLEYELSENGKNFSVGERQLLCMARATLTKSRIVVMDEATASIDHATEAKLQQMVNRDFKEVTVLTIAHRLVTVLDSDRIMVLRDGRVVEFDTPLNLVKKEHGVFHELASEGGVLDQILVRS